MKLFMLSLLAFSIVSPAQAFTINYSSSGGYSFEGWQTKSLSFDYNYANCPLSNAQVEAAINAALDVWNGVPSTSLSVKLGSAVATTPAQAKSPGGPGTPVVVCDTAFSATTGADGDFVPAAASITYADGGHHITNAVLYLNAENGKKANISQMDSTILTVIMAHEIGHALGLGHSSDENALMYYNASAKTELSLSKDDTDGISYLYPRNELGGSTPLGCNLVKPIAPLGLGKKSQSPPTSSFLEFAILIAIFYASTALNGRLIPLRPQGILQKN